MQVLLRQNIPNVGTKGDVITVKKGYYFNYLLPQKFATLANADMLARHEERKKQAVAKAKELEKDAEKVKKQLEKLTLTFEVKAGKKKIYGSISEKDIIEKIKAEAGFELTLDNFPEKEHLKELGTIDVPIQLAKGVIAKVPVEIKALEEEKKPKAKKK